MKDFELKKEYSDTPLIQANWCSRWSGYLRIPDVDKKLWNKAVMAQEYINTVQPLKMDTV